MLTVGQNMVTVGQNMVTVGQNMVTVGQNMVTVGQNMVTVGEMVGAFRRGAGYRATWSVAIGSARFLRLHLVGLAAHAWFSSRGRFFFVTGPRVTRQSCSSSRSFWMRASTCSGRTPSIWLSISSTEWKAPKRSS
jgi:hypothetical protein